MRWVKCHRSFALTLNGLDPYAYLSDVLKRLPTHKVTQIEELLPHCWKPKSN
ncbi:transposase domain-containing protein [Acinetobacter baumannii]|nr:transposase domain-containing protein [Acinetobacter baumannii]WSI14920.1 transposase domain-containing protein [Acinetobacter baumannii]